MKKYFSFQKRKMASPKVKRSQHYFDYVFSKYPDHHQYAMENTTLFDIRYLENTDEKNVEKKFKTGVKILEEDSLWAGKKSGHDRPVIVDNASERVAGGGWRGNNVAQEESICRCSNLGWYLENYVIYDNGERSPYPLTKYQCIYVPAVCVFMKRNEKASQNAFGRDITFDLLEEKDWYFVDVIAIPAIRHPVIPYSVSDRNLMMLKIRAMFLLAKKYNRTCLILGAFGCGVFKNPPEEVAKMFNIVMKEFPIFYCVFAVLGEKNFSVFKNLIKTEFV